MIRTLILSAALILQSASPPSLRDAGEAARIAWERRDLAGFVGASGTGRLLVILPQGRESAPVTADQAKAMLASYVQGTQEVTIEMEGAREVDSLQGYVELRRRYLMVGLPGVREATILLGYRRGREIWVLTEVRVAP